MAKNYYYGSYPFLYWAFNHYFLDGRHQIWVTAPFYNPASPEGTAYRQYGDLLTAVSRSDEKASSEWREFLKKELGKRLKGESLQARLVLIAEKISIPFFVPLVYRVDIESLPLGLATQGDSEGQLGTQHFQIRALEETHFELLFADFLQEDILKLWRGMPNAEAALDVLEAHC
jgi:hypothetical protein